MILKNTLRFVKSITQKAILLGLLFGVNNTLNGATITVVNTNDSGVGSLREAITSSEEDDVIEFSPSLLSGGSATIVLSSRITFPSKITINGLITGSDTLFISGGDVTGIFDINYSGDWVSDTTYLNNLALINGNASGWRGGAVYCRSGHLQINNSVVRNNTAELGGGVYMIAGNSTFRHTLTVNNSTFNNNTSTSSGGAIYCIDGTMTNSQSKVYANYSTFYGNTASNGSSIYARSSISSANFPGTVRSYIYLNQCTVTANNDSSGFGATLYATSSDSNNSSSESFSYVYITNSTVAYNGNYGVYCQAGSSQDSFIYPISSIIASNEIWNFGQPRVSSLGNNIFSLESVIGSVDSDQLDVTPEEINLSTLGFNGGDTKTMAPLPGSITIDAGSSDLVDAQNAPVIGGVRDIGAAEQTTSFSTDTQIACDSYTWIDGQTYTASNNSATYTLMNTAGYDSLVTLDLTVNYLDMVTDVISSCDSYTWIDGNSYSFSTDTPTWTLTNSAGCDSLITLNLTISDTEAPIANLSSLPNLINTCSIESLTPPTASDNCSGLIMGTHEVVLPITTSTTVIWTYSDGNGNVSHSNSKRNY